MKIARKGYATIIFSSFFLILSFGCYRLGVSIFAASDCIFSFAPLLSGAIEQKLITSIKQLSRYTAPNIKETADAIYPDIKNVQVCRYASTITDIAVDIAAPIAQINDDLILSESGALVSRAYFKEYAICNLPYVSVRDVSLLTHSGRSWLVAQIPSLFYQYRIEWHSDNEIYLHDKKNKHICVVSSVDSLMNEQMCQRLAMMEQKIAEKIAHGSRIKEWLADIRFEKQIVLLGVKGGKLYG